jgi:hypothetical protein
VEEALAIFDANTVGPMKYIQTYNKYSNILSQQVRSCCNQWVSKRLKENDFLLLPILIDALQRNNIENLKQIFPEKELRRHNHNFHINVPVSDLFIPTISAYSAAGNNMCMDWCWDYINRSHINVEIGTEAAHFPAKEHINGIFVAVWLVLVNLTMGL